MRFVFALMIVGLAAALPKTLPNGRPAQGVPAGIANQIGSLPPVGSLFAAFLGYNPVHALLAPTGVLHHLPPHNVAVLTGRTFFPQLTSQPFHHGLVIVFSMAIFVLLIAAAASALRGGKYVHEDGAEAATIAIATATSGAGTDVVADDIAAEGADAADGNGYVGRESVRTADGRANPDA